MLVIARLATAHVEAEADRVMPSRVEQGRADKLNELTMRAYVSLQRDATRRDATRHGAVTRGYARSRDKADEQSGCAVSQRVTRLQLHAHSVAAIHYLNAKAYSFSA